MAQRLDCDGSVAESHVVVTDENGGLNTKNLSITDKHGYWSNLIAKQENLNDGEQTVTFPQNP